MARMLATTTALLAAVLGAAVDVPAEEVASVLDTDEVCHAGDTECAMELRQLRAWERKAAVAPHARAAAFGPDAEGEDMWRQKTWTEVFRETQAGVNATDACQRDTMGTCSLFSCGRSRGIAKCEEGKCLCEDGYCATGGACFPKSAEFCMPDTGGTCRVWGCAKSRGATKCEGGKCKCADGSCSWKGSCFPVTDTGGTCHALGCDASRGPVTCHRGRCLCKDGHVAVDGRCQRFEG